MNSFLLFLNLWRVLFEVQSVERIEAEWEEYALSCVCVRVCVSIRTYVHMCTIVWPSVCFGLTALGKGDTVLKMPWREVKLAWYTLNLLLLSWLVPLVPNFLPFVLCLSHPLWLSSSVLLRCRLVNSLESDVRARLALSWLLLLHRNT